MSRTRDSVMRTRRLAGLVACGGLAVGWTALTHGQNTATQTPAAQAPAPQTSRIPDSVKNRETITDDAETTARVDNEPLDPAAKGFLSIPGTTTRLRVGGYARLDAIHDFSPIGSTDDFVVSTIPMDVTSDADNTTIQARQTRVNLEVRRPTTHGDMRVVFENDFFGSSGERAFNLRHAYGQYLNVLGGFTASTLSDSDARPDTLDYESPPARISARHAQLRYTKPFSRQHSVALAIEEPKSDVKITTDQPVTFRTPWPDFVVRYRLDARRGHLQVGSIYRSIGGFVGEGTTEDQVLGIGLVVSGSLQIFRHETLVFESTVGKGVERYVKDTSGLGLDASLDEANRLRAVPLRAGLVGFQHTWSPQWRSSFAASLVEVDNLAGQPDDTYHISRFLTANVLYKPVPSFTVGVEVDYGRLTVKDGRDNSDTRVQVAVQYELVS